MRTVKWFFFGYLGLVVLLVLAIGIAPTLVPEQPRDPDTLYTAYNADIKSFDPVEVSDNISSAVAGNLYECLYNYDYFARPFTVFPELAAEMPRIGADRKVYTIALRHGIHFYDPDKAVWADGKGPEVRVWDVIYSWKRLLDFNLSSPNADILKPVKGAIAWRKYTQRTPDDKVDWERPIEGLRAIDDHTLEITLREPCPDLIFIMSHLPTAIVSREAVEKYGETYRDHPVGTAAYAMRAGDNHKQQRVIMHSNPIYRGRPDVDGGARVEDEDRLPHCKTLDYEFMEEDLPRWFMFRRGLIDATMSVPKETAGSVMSANGQITPEMKNEGVNVITEPDPTIRYIGFNMRDGVVGKNKALRQAMSLAIDRRKYIDVYWTGQELLPVGLIPPGLELYDASKPSPYVAFDLRRAGELMEEARRINGGPIPRLRLLMPGTDTLFRQLGDYFRTAWAGIGIDVDMDYTNWAKFLDQVEQQKTAQMFFLGWGADWPDEQNYFQLFWSKNISKGGLNNFNYSNPGFDEIYEKAVVMPQGPERFKLYRLMLDMLDEDCPYVLLASDLIVSPQHGWVKDFKISEFPHGRLMHVRIDAKKRAQWMARKK